MKNVILKNMGVSTCKTSRVIYILTHLLSNGSMRSISVSYFVMALVKSKEFPYSVVKNVLSIDNHDNHLISLHESSSSKHTAVNITLYCSIGGDLLSSPTMAAEEHYKS